MNDSLLIEWPKIAPLIIERNLVLANVDDQEGLFKLAIQLRTFFYSVIYNTATGYVLCCGFI
jgi:hypothetical protein